MAKSGRGSRVGVVLAGAGARGAYEAGAMSVLLPALEARDQRPSVFIGTSVGGFTAALLASLAHLPAEQAAAELVRTWRRVHRARVVSSIPGAMAATAVRYAAGFLGLPVRLISVLDTTPLAATTADWLDWSQLHANTQEAAVHAVGVVATSCASGRTVVFTEMGADRGQAVPEPDRGRGIDYVATTLRPVHALASASIPVAFPPQWVDGPPEVCGWYLDGGVRLNAPIKPALAFDVDRLVVVATDPAVPPDPTRTPTGPPGPAPDVDDAAAQVLHGILVDRMIEDVRTLGAVNTWVTAESSNHAGGAARRRQGYREVPYLFVGPTRPGTLAADASEVFNAHYRGYWWRDYTLLSRLVGARGANHGELLSFLFFDPDFIERALERGRADARALLAGVEAAPERDTPGPELLDELPWRSGPPDGFPAHRSRRGA